MDSNKLYDELYKIIDNILVITAVKSNIGMPFADTWIADISDHCFDDKTEEEIIKEVCKVYKLPEDKFLIDSTMPLMLIALRIHLYNKCTPDIQIEMRPWVIKLEEHEKDMLGGEK